MKTEKQIQLPKIEFDHEKWRDALPKDISRRKVAKALGVTDSNLISIEKGSSNPSIILAFKYCQLTKLDIRSLIKTGETALAK